ncbi:MAG: hypothetical protein RR398_04750 [Clostridia bacterium]
MNISTLVLVIISILTIFSSMSGFNKSLGFNNGVVFLFAATGLLLSSFSFKLTPDLIINIGSISIVIFLIITALFLEGGSLKTMLLIAAVSIAIVELSRLKYVVEPGIIFALCASVAAFFEKPVRSMLIAVAAPCVSYMLAAGLNMLYGSADFISMSDGAIFDAQMIALCFAYVISLIKLQRRDIKKLSEHILPYNEEDELYGTPRERKAE